MRIAAVIPAYREAARIGSVVRDVMPYVDSVIVVDDGSPDNTADIALSEGASVVRHALNCGAGAATMTGLTAARRLGYDVAVTIDADGQHAAADIPRLLEPIRQGIADLVIANRFGRRNVIPWVRRLANAIGNLLTFAVTGLFLPDTQCGFKAFGPRALQSVEITMSGFEFCTEIIREAALKRWRVASVPSKVVYSEYTLAKGHAGVLGSGMRTAGKILLRSILR